MARQHVDNVVAAQRADVPPSSVSGVEAAALLRFLRQFSVKLKAGLSAEKCLSALSGETRNRRLRTAVKGMHHTVAQGFPLSHAMRNEVGLFDECIIGLIEHGERTRKLRPALASVVDYLEHRVGMEAALRRALVRPLNGLALVMFATFVATVVLSFLVKETLAVPSSGLQTVLSVPDRIAIKVARVVHIAWPYIGVFGFMCFLLFQLFPRSRSLRSWLDEVALRVPLVGPAVQSAGLAIFWRTVGLRMQAGTPMPIAMRIAAITAPNQAMRARIAETIRAIEKSRPYIDALVANGFLRLGDVTAVQAAERRGDLGTLMLSLAGDRDREAAADLKKLTTLMDTLVVGVLGLSIIAVVLTLYVPIFVAR